MAQIVAGVAGVVGLIFSTLLVSNTQPSKSSSVFQSSPMIEVDRVTISPKKSLQQKQERLFKKEKQIQNKLVQNERYFKQKEKEATDQKKSLQQKQERLFKKEKQIQNKLVQNERYFKQKEETFQNKQKQLQKKQQIIEMRTIVSSSTCYDIRRQEQQDYLCQITLQMMIEPIDAPCGHKFQREQIIKRLSIKQECPVLTCKKPLTIAELRPNQLLKKQIKRFKLKEQRTLAKNKLRQIGQNP